MIPLQDPSPKLKFPFWVIVIIAINIIAFYFELRSENPEQFIEGFALIPALVDLANLSSFTPFITSQFLHGGFLHIISNMWFLWIFGDNIEDRLGPIFFPLFYLFSGSIGNFLQFVLMPDSMIPMIGASGAVAGILGAYYAFFPKHKVRTLIPILGLPAIVNIPASLILLYWFILQVFSGGVAAITATADVGGIAYFAHIGGFVFGLLVGRFFF